MDSCYNYDNFNPFGYITIKKGKRIYRLPIKDIIYMEKRKRQIDIFLENGNMENIYKKYADLLETLPNCFVQCHKSYIVNMRKVAMLDGREFIMENKDHLPISQALFPSVSNIYRNYLETGTHAAYMYVEYLLSGGVCGSFLFHSNHSL